MFKSVIYVVTCAKVNFISINMYIKCAVKNTHDQIARQLHELAMSSKNWFGPVK